MGSIISYIQDQEDIKTSNQQSLYLKKVAQIIEKLPPNTEDSRLVEFLWENREKIWRNKKIIELLG